MNLIILNNQVLLKLYCYLITQMTFVRIHVETRKVFSYYIYVNLKKISFSKWLNELELEPILQLKELNKILESYRNIKKN